MATSKTATKKTFVYALDGKPESLDPRKAMSLRAERVTWLLYDTLVRLSSDGRTLERGLAKEVTLVSSGKTLVPGPPDGSNWKKNKDGFYIVHLKLREGVRFHGGQDELDAEIVKASIESYLSSLSRGEPIKARENVLGELIKNIKTDGKYGLVLTLKHPGLHYLSEVPIVNTRAGREETAGYGFCPEGTGPFKFASSTTDRIVLVKNNDYWGGKPPVIDEVEFHIIPDASNLAKELCNGNVHFVPSFPDPALLGQLLGARVRLETKKGWNVFYLGFCADKSSPFTERWVRKAVAQAIDLSRICQSLRIGRPLRGLSSPIAQPARGPLPPGMTGYDRKIGQVSYAPKVAKIVLAGFTGDKSWRLVFNGAVVLNKRLAEAIKENLEENLREVGVTVHLEEKGNFGDVVDAARTPKGSVMFLYSWHVSAPYPERILKPLFHSKSQDTNLTRYESPVVDRLLDQAIQLRETALYSQIQQQIVEDVPMIFLYHSTRMAAYTRCKNLNLNVNAMPHDKLVGADVIP